MNHFAITRNNYSTNVEREANLFAVALLAENNINDRLNTPLTEMNNYLLKSILDYNLEIQ